MFGKSGAGKIRQLYSLVESCGCHVSESVLYAITITTKERCFRAIHSCSASASRVIETTIGALSCGWGTIIKLFGQRKIFQQDNDHKYAARSTEKWLWDTKQTGIISL